MKLKLKFLYCLLASAIVAGGAAPEMDRGFWVQCALDGEPKELFMPHSCEIANKCREIMKCKAFETEDGICFIQNDAGDLYFQSNDEIKAGLALLLGVRFKLKSIRIMWDNENHQLAICGNNCTSRHLCVISKDAAVHLEIYSNTTNLLRSNGINSSASILNILSICLRRSGTDIPIGESSNINRIILFRHTEIAPHALQDFDSGDFVVPFKLKGDKGEMLFPHPLKVVRQYSDAIKGISSEDFKRHEGLAFYKDPDNENIYFAPNDALIEDLKLLLRVTSHDNADSVLPSIFWDNKAEALLISWNGHMISIGVFAAYRYNCKKNKHFIMRLSDFDKALLISGILDFCLEQSGLVLISKSIENIRRSPDKIVYNEARNSRTVDQADDVVVPAKNGGFIASYESGGTVKKAFLPHTCGVHNKCVDGMRRIDSFEVLDKFAFGHTRNGDIHFTLNERVEELFRFIGSSQNAKVMYDDERKALFIACTRHTLMITSEFAWRYHAPKKSRPQSHTLLSLNAIKENDLIMSMLEVCRINLPNEDSSWVTEFSIKPYYVEK